MPYTSPTHSPSHLPYNVQSAGIQLLVIEITALEQKLEQLRPVVDVVLI
jgi:hypothetical protein